MNLGKLLVAGKSIINGRAEVSVSREQTRLSAEIRSDAKSIPARRRDGGAGIRVAGRRRAGQKGRPARRGQDAKAAALVARAVPRNLLGQQIESHLDLARSASGE